MGPDSSDPLVKTNRLSLLLSSYYVNSKNILKYFLKKKDFQNLCGILEVANWVTQ